MPTRSSPPAANDSLARLRSARLGLVFAVLTVLYGQFLGIVFGLNEAAIKSRLQASAQAVQATVYKGDAAAMKPVLEKSWAYMQRAHLHACGMGTTAVILIVLLALLAAQPRLTTVLGAGLGLGGLGYSVYWMWAGFRAPGLGGTGAAKESLGWLAMPASGAFVIGTVGALVVIVAALYARPTGAPATKSNGPDGGPG